MITVSIIIPLYNRIHLIPDTLNSLQPQLHSGVNLEVIVVDDGSTDGGGEYVEINYPWVLLITQPNSGAPTARNKGLEISTGKYVVFLDSDDLVEPNFFLEKVNLMEKKYELNAVYGPFDHFSEQEKGNKFIIPRFRSYPIIPYANFKDHLINLLSGQFIVPHAILWRKEVLQNDLKGFSPKLKVNQDVDIFFRYLVKKNPIIGINSPKALYRVHMTDQRTGAVGGSATKAETILQLRREFKNKLIEENLFDSEVRKSLAKSCFDFWANFRITFPDIAEEFYQLSLSINPNPEVKGGIYVKLIAKILGAKRTLILKSYLK